MRLQPERTADERADSLATLACCDQGLQERSLLGLGPGDRFGDFRGASGPLKGKGATSAKAAQIAGKARFQARFAGHIAARRSLHGKEGVDGSSPSEGLSGTTKPLQKAVFLLPIKTL